MTHITDEARTAAHEAAVARWITGSSDATQMLLCVDAALEAALPHLEGATPCDHSESLYGRCVSCGKTWETQAREREGATPAIDREALQRLIDGAEHYDTCSYALNPSAGYECSCMLADLRALIGDAS